MKGHDFRGEVPELKVKAHATSDGDIKAAKRAFMDKYGVNEKDAAELWEITRWHHSEYIPNPKNPTQGEFVMRLVDKDLHEALKHTGARAIYEFLVDEAALIAKGIGPKLAYTIAALMAFARESAATGVHGTTELMREARNVRNHKLLDDPALLNLFRANLLKWTIEVYGQDPLIAEIGVGSLTDAELRRLIEALASIDPRAIQLFESTID